MRKVFISSTLRDLREYRQAVSNEVRRSFGMDVLANEVMEASPNDPVTELYKLIDQCDIFIGIYANRYGHIPKGQQFSYIELEYEYAKSRGKPIFCFILDRNHQWSRDMIDEDNYLVERLNTFKEKMLSERVVAFFTTPEDLEMKVISSIRSHYSNMKAIEPVLSSESDSQLDFPIEERLSEETKKVTKKSKRKKSGGIEIEVSGDIIALGDKLTIAWVKERDDESPEMATRRKNRRLLNAGFASRDGKLLETFAPLVSNDFYNLQMDVGPLWEDEKSIVVKNQKAFFPEKKLPPTKNGYLVRTIFISEDFSPHQSSADLWIPAKKGQSFPLVDGKRAETAGVVNLHLRAPRLGIFQSQRRAFGRLCLYYKGQLIQSAVVSAGIARTQKSKLKEPNKIEIDYVLTGNFENTKRLVNRRVKFNKKSKPSPVAVNITMNDDGAGHHRILATYHLNSDEELTVPPAWKPYDAQSAQKELEKFRKILSSCYEGLDDNLGKTRARFGHDLLKLAILGDRLRELALSDLDVGGKEKTVKLWQEEFFRTLERGTVIQIARTGPANYIFPWALVYEYPMPGPKYELCDVILEWGENGLRKKDPEAQCPYHNEEWHAQNIICPYGFWGLKHIIEQPLAAVSKTTTKWAFDVTDRISLGRKAIFGTGVTDDVSDIGARDRHIIKLAQKLQAQLKPQRPANDRLSALDMLRSPEIVYFLCHGEVDKELTPYLSIGKHIDNDDYKIFPNTLGQWGRLRKTGLNLKQWSDIRPLVFINACHSIELKPGIVLNFVSAFADLGASGVIGTEVSVRDDMAIVVAEAILNRVSSKMEVGQAIREMRWELLNRGNVLGLAYTPYSLANLHIQRRR